MVLLLATFLAAVVLPAGASAAGRGRRAPLCLPRPGTTASDGFGQVWADDDSGDIWGCAYGHHRVHLLENLGDAPFEDFGVVAMGGRFVAAEGWAGDPDSGYVWDYICVFDVLDGHRLACFGSANGPRGYGGGPVGSMVVKPDGATAWIAEPNWNNVPNQVKYGADEVYVDDAHGYRMVASGTGIAAGSLALEGNRIYWVQDGAARFAAME